MRFILLLWLILLGAAASYASETRGLRITAKDSASGQTGEVLLYNKTYAVVIGIDRYSNLSPDRQLKNAVKDAKGIENTLRKFYRFDKIFAIHDEQATRDNIMRLLTSELPKTIGKEDALFIFWAGHGNQEKTDDGELGYLIPYDGSSDGIYGNITMSQLKDDISRAVPAKHVFYAFDACYSGLLTSRSVDKKVSRNLAYLKDITKERVRQVLTAGSKGQEALDGGPRGHSVFTGRLIEILEAAGDFITANEIQAILKERVYQDARARGHEQTPGFGTLYGSGDFVFIPNIEQKLEDNKAEMARIEAELKRYEMQEADAKKYQTEQQRREAGQKRKVAEAQLKAEQLRRQQLADEVQRQQEMAAERAKFDAEQKQKEQELATARTSDELRLAALKAELASRKKSVPATAGESLAAAVAEIRSMNTEIERIEAVFSSELKSGINRIKIRYDAEINTVQQQSQQKLRPLVRDEFETEADFRARSSKQRSSYNKRIVDLEQKKHKEISELEERLAVEQRSQTADLRKSLQQLVDKQYSIGSENLALELGQYDPDRQNFPVTIRNLTQLVKLDIKGTIPLPPDLARKFKQEYNNGLVRPQATVKAGNADTVTVTLLNDSDNSSYLYLDGEFLTGTGRKRREAEREDSLARAKRDSDQSRRAAAQSASIVIKFSHVVAQHTPKGQAADYFKKIAEERTGGRVRIEVYPNSQLYKDREEMEALQLGAVQMLAPSIAKFAPLGVKGFEIFDLPFIFDGYQELHKVTQGPVGAKLLKMLEPKGIQGLAYWDNGFKVMSANKPLKAPEDFQGQKMRIQSSKVLDAQMRSMGAVPQVMAFSEVYQALQAGTVDGTENPPSNLYSQKMHEVQKYVTLSDHGYLGYAVIVNKKFWMGLPADIRTILEGAMKDATEYANDLAKKGNDDAIAAVKKSGRSQLISLTPQERAAWKKAMDKAHKEHVSRLGADLVDQFYAAVGYDPN